MEIDTVGARDKLTWRTWLAKNHLKSPGAWVVFKKGEEARRWITYDEALDEALAYGWIDSVIRRVDASSYVRKFSPRRKGSIWSSRNIARVEQLKTSGRMTPWGLAAYNSRTSEISMLEKVNREGMGFPEDLELAIRSNPKAFANFRRFAPSHKKRYVIWVEGAKRPETRKRRIEEAVKLISGNLKELLK